MSEVLLEDFRVNATAKDKGPTLPKNIVRIMRALLAVFSKGVGPRVNPTVPKAEVVS